MLKRSVESLNGKPILDKHPALEKSKVGVLVAILVATFVNAWVNERKAKMIKIIFGYNVFILYGIWLKK